MNVHINQLYLVGIHIPSVLNAPSPLKGLVPLPVLDAVRQENAGKGAWSVLSMKRHFCILIDYDHATRIGVLVLGTTRPVQPHRFVPGHGTPRMDYQPPHFIHLTDNKNQLRASGYYMFSHALRATLIFPGEALDRQVLPPPAFCKDSFGDPVEMIEAFVSQDQVDLLKILHNDYWCGVRYMKDGTPTGGSQDGPEIDGGGGGGGGGAGGGAEGGAEGGPGAGTSGGRGIGGQPGTGTSGASQGGPGSQTTGGPGIGGQPGKGISGASQGGPGTGTSGAWWGSLRPINRDGTVEVPASIVRGEGFSDSAADRLSRALEWEEERIIQMEIMEGGGKDLPPPEVVCYLAPWRDEGLGGFDVL